MIKQRREESILRKKQRRKKLFGSPAKKAAWIFMGSAFSALVVVLCVILGTHIHKENEIADAIKYSQRWFDDMQEDVTKLQDKLENLYLVSGEEPTLLEKGQMENITTPISEIDRYKKWIDNDCEVDGRVVNSIDNYVKRKTSYNSWEEYKTFLKIKLLVSDTPEKGATQLIKTRTYNSQEEIKRIKQSKSLYIDSLNMSTNSNYHVVTGSVTNNTSSTVKFVVVEIHLKDADGITFDTDTTYACGEEGIRPGASAKFECHLDKDSRTERCAAWILRYD